jgi:hypothetical protein
MDKVDVVVLGQGVTEIASFVIDLWTPGQTVNVYSQIENSRSPKWRRNAAVRAKPATR